MRQAWFNRKSGHILPAESDIFASQSHFMTPDIFPPLKSQAPAPELTYIVSLPDKLDRTLSGMSAVLPRQGLHNKPTKVTILGQNFSNDARVFIAGKEATQVEVLGRDFLTATLPPIDKALLEGEPKKSFTVTVFTGGDPLQKKEAFTYLSAAATKKPEKFKLDKIVPAQQAGGKTIQLVANTAHMDKVKEVWFGAYKVHPNNMQVGEDKKSLTVTVPQNAKTPIPTGTEVFIVLHFDPAANITPTHTYQYKKVFIYK